MVEIELDAFSGRPNPRWSLSAHQSAEYLAQLRGLQRISQVPAGFEGLGYRGFVVRPERHTELDAGLEEARHCHGAVVVRRGEQSEVLSDPGRGLERWLAESMRGHVDESLFRYIAEEIER